MIRAIVFDFDGVLIESVHIKTNAFARLFEHEGPEIVKQVVAYHLKNGGLARIEKFRYFYRHILQRELSDSQLRTLCEEFKKFVLDGVVNATWVEGAREALDACQQKGIATFIVSGTPEEELHLIVQRRKMASYFSGIYGSPETKLALLRSILSATGFETREILFVGDALTDYNAAREAGIQFVARSDRESADSWAKYGVEVLPNLRRLLEVVGRLSKKRPALTAGSA